MKRQYKTKNESERERHCNTSSPSLFRSLFLRAFFIYLISPYFLGASQRIPHGASFFCAFSFFPVILFPSSHNISIETKYLNRRRQKI